jgi:hypothetical protein
VLNDADFYEKDIGKADRILNGIRRMKSNNKQLKAKDFSF